MGGNATFQGNLADGGTTYIDDGKPLPGLFEETLRNLREVSPTYFANVPAGYAMLATALEKDDAAGQALLQEPQLAGLWRRHLAVRSLRTHGGAGGEAHRLPPALRHRLGLDRDGADGDHGALGLRTRRPDRPAVSRRAAQARADGRGGALRAASQERDRHARLFPPARPHGRDVRRGGLLQDRRRRPLRRSRRSELGPDLRRPGGRGLQADERHLRAGRHLAHHGDRRRHAGAAGRRDLRPGPRLCRLAGLPQHRRLPAHRRR